MKKFFVSYELYLAVEIRSHETYRGVRSTIVEFEESITDEKTFESFKSAVVKAVIKANNATSAICNIINYKEL